MKTIRHLIYILIAILFPLNLCAQKNPKWFKKARNMQLTVYAYDQAGQMKECQGYFLNETGEVLTEYNILKNATRAKLVDGMGKEYQVDRIKGASSLYNIAKLTSSEVVKPYTVARLTDALSIGTAVYIMPLCSTDPKSLCMVDTIQKVDTFEDGHNYYTLSADLDERLAGAPVLTSDGLLIGSIQLAAEDGKSHGYIISASYGETLKTSAMDANNIDLRAILIPKALPADETQATTYLYLANKQDTVAYRANVEDFIKLFPKNSTGYIQLAEYETKLGNYAKAEQVYSDGLQQCTEHLDEIHHSFAKILYQLGLRNEKPVIEGWTLDKALAEAEAAYSASPMGLYTALQGMILYAQQKYAEAYTKFMEMGNSNMRSSEYFLYAAQCKQMLQATPEEILAIQDSAVACYAKPYPVEAAKSFYLRSKTLTELKRFREAVADLNEYEHLLSAQVSAQFYYEREQVEMQCRMFQQALNDIERAANMEPREPLYRAEEAVVNYRVGQLDEAIKAASEAIRLDDTFADAHRILGICLKDKGKVAEARKELERAIELGDEISKSVLEKF